MPSKTFQRFNKKTGAWVKFKQEGNKARIVNVKESKPTTPFKGVRRG